MCREFGGLNEKGLFAVVWVTRVIVIKKIVFIQNICVLSYLYD